MFEYGDREIEHLKSKCSVLAEAIDKIGKIERPTNPDLFGALMNAIIGQQISTKAQAKIWGRMQALFPELTPQAVAEYPSEELQKIGVSFRKVGYMQDIAQKIHNKEVDLEALQNLSDEEVCKELSKFKGIGVWTAEMLMIFSMQRPNVLSFGDLAILRGLRMLYRHREITPKLFAKYHRRFSPYASVASLYLWAIAGGAIPELTDLKRK